MPNLFELREAGISRPPINPKNEAAEITCHDCKKSAELAGYRFTLVPLRECCRIEREVEITGNRFERRMKR